MLPTQDKDFTLDEEILAVSLELSKGSWKVALQALVQIFQSVTLAALESGELRWRS